jgi:hypothetical protein
MTIVRRFHQKFLEAVEVECELVGLVDSVFGAGAVLVRFIN